MKISELMTSECICKLEVYPKSFFLLHKLSWLNNGNVLAFCNVFCCLTPSKGVDQDKLILGNALKKMYRKRSRVRVKIEGQRGLLQSSLQIKMFDFCYIAKSPYESHLSRHTFESRKNLVKILETRPQSSKNAKKWIFF